LADPALLQSLAQPAQTKLVLLVLDGLGGMPREAGGPTELEAASTPNLDRLAAEGQAGLSQPIGLGITPGSGPGHLALFGYDPVASNIGRGALSALGLGLQLDAGDLGVRLNFCTLDDEGIVVDRRAGRIDTRINQALVSRLNGIKIPGVELACQWDRGGLHIVVLFLEPEPGPLQDRLAEFRAEREVRNREMCRRLQESGIEIDYQEVINQAQGNSVGRPHFGALLVAKGYVPDISTAFRDYLGANGVAYTTRPLLPPEEVTRLARSSGGVPVVAHPHTLGLNTAEEYADFFRQAAAYGLVGVECYYSGYSTETRRQLEDSIRSFGLLPSGGSDYHGSYKPGLQLGVGYGDLMVPDRILEDLRARQG